MKSVNLLALRNYQISRGIEENRDISIKEAFLILKPNFDFGISKGKLELIDGTEKYGLTNRRFRHYRRPFQRFRCSCLFCSLEREMYKRRRNYNRY